VFGRALFLRNAPPHGPTYVAQETTSLKDDR
jgi:hypothetical protein